MDYSWILFALLYAAAVSVVSKIIKIPSQPNRKIPPGPKPWPVIGNLNLLGSIPPHQALHLLSQKYGEIMQLKFGKFPVVVASSPEMAKQFLRVHDASFASRPFLAVGKYTSYNYSDLVWAPYGPYWRQIRRIYFWEVFSAKKLKLYEKVRADERQRFLSSIRALAGKPIVLKDHLSRYSLMTIWKMLSKDEYFSETKGGNSVLNMDELHEMVDEWFMLSGVFNIGDWIPWLSPFDLQGYVKKMKDLNKKMDKFYNYVIDDHIARRAAEKDECAPMDFVDTLLQMAEDGKVEVAITRDCVKALIQNLIVGSMDTSATMIEWAIHEILRQPHIIEKAKAELDRVIGRSSMVGENDFSRLPYLDAIVTETFRLHPVGTMLAPHYAIQDCNVAGYDISKGTTVFVNVWSIGRDPRAWDSPEKFSPERFLGKETDVLGGNFALLPFGSGRRMCPGYNLGLKVVRTTLANLLHGFDLKLIDGMRPQDVSLEEEYGLTTHPKHLLSLLMEPTLPSHLY